MMVRPEGDVPLTPDRVRHPIPVPLAAGLAVTTASGRRVRLGWRGGTDPCPSLLAGMVRSSPIERWRRALPRHPSEAKLSFGNGATYVVDGFHCSVRIIAPLSPSLKSVRENSVVPPGLESFVPLYPALKRWLS
jgi:hypothetical protein